MRPIPVKAKEARYTILKAWVYACFVASCRAFSTAISTPGTASNADAVPFAMATNRSGILLVGKPAASTAGVISRGKKVPSLLEYMARKILTVECQTAS